MQDIYISIGQNIRRRRKEKLLTQESLAANVETSAQYISRIERGQVCPSLEFLYRLSAALECPIYSLLPSTAPSASTSFFSQELASQLNSCTPQQQQFLMSFISWFLQQSTPFSEKTHFIEGILMLALYISLLDTEEQISKFEHIYTKYRGLMFYTAKGVLQDSYLAEDAVHETFLDIIRIIDSIRANNEKELSQFLRVLTHHKAVDMVRKCTRQKKSDTEIEDFDLSKSDVNVETIVLDKIDYENMLLRVQSMDEKYKTPLLLKVQGYKVSEIADFLNISPGNVKVRLHRARKIILTGLEENGNE